MVNVRRNLQCSYEAGFLFMCRLVWARTGGAFSDISKGAAWGRAWPISFTTNIVPKSLALKLKFSLQQIKFGPMGVLFKQAGHRYTLSDEFEEEIAMKVAATLINAAHFSVHNLPPEVMWAEEWAVFNNWYHQMATLLDLLPVPEPVIKIIFSFFVFTFYGILVFRTCQCSCRRPTGSHTTTEA